MIVTLTANPSIDRTMALGRPLERGGVVSAASVTDEPGGKGVNVARVLSLAGAAATAVLPADAGDPLLAGLSAAGVQPVPVPVGRAARVNITITEPDGTTTKVNDAGRPLPAKVLDALGDRLLEASLPGGWVVLAGSLPPGVPEDWYAVLTERLQSAGRRVAVDTSGRPLTETVRRSGRRPDLLKPNADELASLTGDDPAQLEGDVRRAEQAARRLVSEGVGAILLTLGASGALLVTAEGTWQATPPRIRVRSTVGAGDSSLAGYLLAEDRGADAPTCLSEAVAFGAAAASLPGSTMPRESDLDRDGVVVSAFDAAR
ncbi:MAG TPA: 1-phosphofructokinase family hexose kinase [Intrasporangium sp.]|uniref:1-phosphofructokinase family hexose kinase n=1 Tax=Intrasporangium sp. TaxID=1925024 RepID=UPI002D765A46|nr:1-phosphofructokinase family hexose kinase [Intrasporangium sp.]HET7398096.1 1-phosphofructokinase family hexose kinase [Intrasporangium sp.]